MQNNRTRVLGWIQAGLIEEKNISQALIVADAQPCAQQWLAFTKQVMLWLSVVCAATGIIFFFAYNWQELSRMSRFALAEGAMLVTSLVYLRFSTHAKFKVALLMAMVLLTGALLALIGQTYQTGADPWQLFMIWCALITPWALIARSSVIWIFWVVLLNTGCVLLFELNLNVRWFPKASTADMLLNLFLINTVILSVFELGVTFEKHALFHKIKFVSQDNRYTQQVLLSISIYLLCHWGIEGILDEVKVNYLAVIYLSAAALVYRFIIQDLLALAVISLGFLAVSSAILFQGLDAIDADFFGYMLLGALYLLGASSLIGIYLNKVAKVFSQKPESKKNTIDKEKR